MARLKSVGPRLGSLKSRVGVLPRDKAKQSRFRDRGQPWRRWYKTARWQRLRLRILERDLYRCQATGVDLTGAYPAPNSPVIDHIRPHRGNETLFWDESNLQAVSKAWHDSEKQSADKRTID